MENLLLAVDLVSEQVSLREYIKTKVTAPGREVDDPFFVVNLGRLIELHRDWVTALPTITPFYAVKCNEDPVLLKTLATLGTGFDCASKNEIETVLSLGVTPERVIYANPCKQVSHLKYAARRGVDLMTFDNGFELQSIHEHFSSARLVLRIKADDPNAGIQLGAKFGCSIVDGKLLLDDAKILGMSVVGISFHVGTDSQSPTAYETALKMAAELFAYGSQIGYQFSLLDIGGGFPGDKKSKEVFHKISSAINSTVNTHFSPEAYPGLRIIAEPGRYFACSTHILVIRVISKRSCDKEEGKQFMYYVNDGAYMSFAYSRLDYSSPMPFFLKECSGPLYSSIMWGPTCTAVDKLGETLLPELNIGDWMYFDDMGAYTRCLSTNFNGFSKTKSHYYITRDNQAELDELFQLCQLSPFTIHAET